MILDQGFSYREVCHQLDLGGTGLRRWVDQLQSERNGGVPKSEALTDERKKIQELESRIHRLQREEFIVKRLQQSWYWMRSIDPTDRYTEKA